MINAHQSYRNLPKEYADMASTVREALQDFDRELIKDFNYNMLNSSLLPPVDPFELIQRNSDIAADTMFAVHIGSMANILALQKTLHTGSTSQQKAALEVLEYIAGNKTDSGGRIEALQTLTKYSREATIRACGKLLSYGDRSLTASIVAVLKEAGGYEDFIYKIGKESNDVHVQRLAAESLRESGDIGYHYLLKGIAETNGNFQAYIIGNATFDGERRAVPFLIDRLERGMSKDNAMTTIAALGNLKADTAVSLLRTILMNADDINVIGLCISSLRKIGGREARRVVRRFTRHPSEEIRNAVNERAPYYRF